VSIKLFLLSECQREVRAAVATLDELGPGLVVLSMHIGSCYHDGELGSRCDNFSLRTSLRSGVGDINFVNTFMQSPSQRMARACNCFSMTIIGHFCKRERKLCVFDVNLDRSIISVNGKGDSVLALKSIQLHRSREKKVASMIDSITNVFWLSSHKLVGVKVKRHLASHSWLFLIF